MEKTNKKGFGLVTAVFIVLVLFIMAAGFFHITNFSTNTVRQNERQLRLYWAAESASNYNVNWWANQPADVRIDWPSQYSPPTNVYGGSQDSGGTGPSLFFSNTYDDINFYEVDENVFPRGEGIAKEGKLYLHASSVLEHPGTSVVDGFEIITIRYKGERIDKEGKAVWVLDSYAWDPETGEYANIVLTNVWNDIFDAELDWLANAEALVTSIYSEGFGGARSSFSEKDVRFGQCYYASQITWDSQTTNPPKFFGFMGDNYAGIDINHRVLSASGTQSGWGNSPGQHLISADHYYGMGLHVRGQHGLTKTLEILDDGFGNGIINPNTGEEFKTPYHKNAPLLDNTNVVWSWDDIKNEGENDGILLLPESGGGAITIKLDYNNSTGITRAHISGVPSITEPITVGKSTGTIRGIAVPSNWGQVKISGVSGSDFTLVTEKSQVLIEDDFYVAEMANTRNTLHHSDFVQGYTNRNELERLWKAMKDTGSNTKLSVISQLGLPLSEFNEAPFLFNSQGSQGGGKAGGGTPSMIFTTAAYLTPYGSLEGIHFRHTTRFINIGSMITLNNQGMEFGANASTEYMKIMIQDQRYLDPEFGIPEFWGPGPSEIIEESQVFGLNPHHRWAKGSVGKTNDWNRVVWRTNYSPQF